MVIRIAKHAIFNNSTAAIGMNILKSRLPFLRPTYPVQKSFEKAFQDPVIPYKPTYFKPYRTRLHKT